MLVVERHTLPMVAVAVVWPRGAMFDPVGREGLATLTAALLDEGTTGRGALALATTLQGLGTSIESGAGWDTSAVSMVTLRKNLDTSMSLLAEVALQPAFAPVEFERVKAEQIASVQQRKDSAQAVASEQLLGAVYGAGQRLGVALSGTEASLGSIQRDDVVRFHQGLRLDQCVVIVAGDVEAEAMRALLERHFGAAKLRPAATPAQVTAGGSLPAPRRLVIDKPGAPQSEVRLGLPGPPRSSPDWLPLVVMNEILGGGDFSNRLNLNLREAHAFAYGASSMFGFHKAGGAFLVATATKTEVTGPALREALGELERIRGEAVHAEEVRFAKDSLQRSMARRFETLQDVVFELAANEVFGLPEDFFATFPARVEAITDGDILRVARQYLDPAQLSIVIVGDAAALSLQLGALTPGAPGRMSAGRFEGLPQRTPESTPEPTPPMRPSGMPGTAAPGRPPPIPSPAAR